MKPLFVDDSVEVLELARFYFLNELAIDLRITRDELEAVRMVASREVDLLIADHELRPGGGMGLYNAIREFDARIPFVLVSLYPPSDQVRRFLAETGVSVVYKNDIAERFLDSLRRAVMSSYEAVPSG